MKRDSPADSSPRRSKRTRAAPRAIPFRVQNLFFDDKGPTEGMVLPKNVEPIATAPNMYHVRNFLSEKEIEYFEALCSQYDKKFKCSFTEDENNEEVRVKSKKNVGAINGAADVETHKTHNPSNPFIQSCIFTPFRRSSRSSARPTLSTYLRDRTVSCGASKPKRPTW